MRKVMLSVAPVSAADTHIDPVEIAAEVAACYRAGAAMVHLHCRDAHGRLTSELSVLQDTVQRIQTACPIIIEISTGGVSDLTIQERCAPCVPAWVECNSLNVGSVNLGEAVYRNPICEVRYCVQQILTHHKIPEIEVFEPGMIYTARELSRQYDFVRPLLFSIVLGHAGAMPATVPALDIMLRALEAFFPAQENVLWGITHANRRDWEVIAAALSKGASSVRIGFEDSDFLDAETQVKSNVPLVEKAVALLKEQGLSRASPSEARMLLQISNHCSGQTNDAKYGAS